MKQSSEIKKTMTFSEIMVKHPQSAEFFAKKGWGCFGCPMASMETLEEGAKAHGLDAKELKKLLKDLEKFVEEK